MYLEGYARDGGWSVDEVTSAVPTEQAPYAADRYDLRPLPGHHLEFT